MNISVDSHKLIVDYIGEGYYNQVIITKDLEKAYSTKYGKETKVNENIVDSLKLLKYNVESGCPLTLKLSELVGEYGDLQMLKYIHKKDCPWDRNTSSHIAERGNLAMLKYVRNNGCEIGENIIHLGIMSGKLSIVKYLYENGYGWYKEEYSEDSAEKIMEYGDLKMLKYAHKNGCPWDMQATEKADEVQNYEMLNYAIKNGCEASSFITYYALFEDDTGKALKYLEKSDNIKYNESILERFAREGNYEMFRTAVYHDSEPDINKEDLCIDAAHGGSVKILEIVHGLGCWWDECTTFEAASKGHIECLKYAVENGCKLSRRALKLAKKKKHVECATYIREKLKEKLKEEYYSSASEESEGESSEESE